MRDDGIGLAADMLPRVFELFVQVERRVDRSQGGIVIGLSLVRRLVELHGGSVTAHSDGSGRGTEFVVRLPLGQDRGARIEERADPSSGLARSSLLAPRSCRVLVVDDNPDAADSLALVLRAAKQQVRTAYDGQSALTAADEFRPAVVLLDIGMPGMDGYETAARLRQQLPEVRLVALTGWGQEDDRRRGGGRVRPPPGQAGGPGGGVGPAGRRDGVSVSRRPAAGFHCRRRDRSRHLSTAANWVG